MPGFVQQIVIGFGTGRCGTNSLAAFLNQQPGYHVTHEQAGLAWYPAITDTETCMGRFFASRTGTVIGDVGFYWINYLPLILRTYQGAKAINIRRPLDEVVESFWTYKDHGGWDAFSNWYGYPFDAPTQTKDDIASTIRRYRFLEIEVQKLYPGSIYVMPTKDLNDTPMLEELLDWLGTKEHKMLRQFFLNTRGEILNKKPKAPSIPFEGVLRRKDALL